MTSPHHGSDVEWLDDDGAHDPRGVEELAGRDASPVRRRGVVGLGLVAVLLVGAGLVAAGHHDEPSPRPSGSTVTAPPTLPTTPQFGLELTPVGSTPVESTPVGPPASVLTAIRSVFPGAVLTLFVATDPRPPETRPALGYTLRWRDRTITVGVRPIRPEDIDLLYRTHRSLRLAQELRSSWVDLRVRVARGSTTERDFAALQRLILDTRLLATR